jgi:hypothetical protein
VSAAGGRRVGGPASARGRALLAWALAAGVALSCRHDTLCVPVPNADRLLFNGRGDVVDVRPAGGCDSTALAAGGPDARGCGPEIVRFARGRTLLVVTHPSALTAGPPVDTPAALAALEPPATPPFRVPVSIWVLTDSPGAAADMALDLREAGRRFDSSRAGLGFRIVQVDTAFGAARDRLSSVSDLGQWAVAGTPFYAESTLNVYVVDSINGLRQSHGYDFFPYGHPEVIFISLRYHLEWTLAHEIGHALGLAERVSDKVNCGHPQSPFGGAYCPGLDARNLMWDAEPEGGQLKLFTLGQTFRMNVDTRSWLNQAHLRLTPLSRACQNDCWAGCCVISHPCPRITLDVPEGP